MDPHAHGDVPADPQKFREAIDAFLDLTPMTREQYDALEASEQDFAFVLADVAQADIVAQAYEALLSAIEDGTDFETFQGAVGDALEESWGEENPGRLETIFRTSVMSSYGDGRHEQMTSPDTAAARPYWRYDGIDGGCPICEPCNGTILLSSHEWWQTHYPILHPNCRDLASPLSKDEADEEGISPEPPESPDPVEGFGHPPVGAATSSADDFDPDAASYPGGLGDLLNEKLADDAE